MTRTRNEETVRLADLIGHYAADAQRHIIALHGDGQYDIMEIDKRMVSQREEIAAILERLGRE